MSHDTEVNAATPAYWFAAALCKHLARRGARRRFHETATVHRGRS
jgi:hypothetical protein